MSSATTDATSADRVAVLRRAAPRFRWQPVPVPVPEPGAGSGTVLVIGGDTGSRRQVRDLLATNGYRVNTLDLDDDHVAALSDDTLLEATGSSCRAIGDAHGVVDGVVDLGIAGSSASLAPGSWRPALRRTVAVLKGVYDDWAAETRADRLFYLCVTRLGGRMGYDGTGISQPLGGIWAGLAKTLPQELPNCRVKVVDLAADVDAAPVVLGELSTWDLFEIGWRGDERVTLGADRCQPPTPRVRLGPDDTVLLSGGGRGLGFALARELAAGSGCRVVVSGRHPLPGDEDWALMPDAEFDRCEKERYRSLPAGTTIRVARAETTARRARREVARNLADAERAGLRIEYLAGDVTDAAFARSLVTAAGPGLRVVVHNAGVASPTRLRNKDISSFLATVSTKVDGFTALIHALEDHSLDYFCNVGSVSGRIGGMVGQIDYAAANEALTRLGFWAGTRGVPAATLCWPTWQQLGLVANYDAALRYAAALPVAEGVTHWVAEIQAAEPGEVMYLGGIGRAISPGQLKGFAKFRGHPDTRRLQTLSHYLGDLEEHAPFRSLRSRTALDAGTHPCLSEVRRSGAPVLPVSVALEYALSTGDWVVPEGWPELWLHELRDVEIRLSGLTFTDGHLELVKSGTGRKGPHGWEVALELLGADGRPVLRALARYGDRSPGRLDPQPCGPWQAGEPAPAAIFSSTAPWGAPLEWSGMLYRPVAWRRCEAGGLTGTVEPVTPADEWTVPAPPAGRLPHAAIESAVMALCASPTLTPAVDELRLALLRFADPADDEPANTVTCSGDLADWWFGPSPSSAPITLTGLRLGGGAATS